MTCQPIQLTRKCISISGVDIERHKWGGGQGPQPFHAEVRDVFFRFMKDVGPPKGGSALVV